MFFFTTDVLDAFAPFDDPLELFDDFALLPKKEDAPVFFPFNFFKGALERDDEEDDDDEEVDRSVRIGSAIWGLVYVVLPLVIMLPLLERNVSPRTPSSAIKERRWSKSHDQSWVAKSTKKDEKEEEEDHKK